MHVKKINIDEDLKEALWHEPGYRYPVRYVRNKNRINIEGYAPGSLKAFLYQVARMAHEHNIDEHVGTGYIRIIDASKPENHLLWHRDNEDGGVRFTTALSTDDVDVNLMFSGDPSIVGKPTSLHSRVTHPRNGELIMFTTETHGVPQLPSRDAKTVVFFSTLHNSWQEVDLYTTHCDPGTNKHAALPTLAKKIERS